MRFLVDRCAGHRLAEWLRSQGHAILESPELGPDPGDRAGYPLKAGQLEYDCCYSKMHGMPVTGGRGFRGLKPLWYNGVPP